ncbi:16916_t:CDS:1 [Funneliformis geosporum]|uniref:6972_t:CDS:1 n=1 Tax=Funneliformis geosporum TaxID=1117311 RepID=A0A9W4SB44_9GLOM|nr:6972_t:CDS:1 [Funneliformis geosporum]CAI2164129.1 16916_t:CDS:1 [Funneliformis geosporum]
MNSLSTISARHFITVTTRTKRFSPILSINSFHRSFQTSLTNNEEEGSNIDNDKNEKKLLTNDSKKQIDLIDEIFYDLNPVKKKDTSSNNKDLLSVFKESLSSNPIENKPISTPSNFSEISPKTSILNSFRPPTIEISTSTSEITIDNPEVTATFSSEANAQTNDESRFVREDPVISLLTNMIMRDGKKATARRFVADAMIEIRKQTHNDPYLITKSAIEKASPMVSHMSSKKGSKVTLIPRPLNERQRQHKGIKWILDASDKRSGKVFSIRLANEILAVINGSSTALQKKEQLHKLVMANRANLPVKW